MQMKRKLES
jgi:hypothetical protein